MEQAEVLKTKLCDESPPELQEDFLEYVKQQSDIAAKGRENGLVQGFRLAAK